MLLFINKKTTHTPTHKRLYNVDTLREAFAKFVFERETKLIERDELIGAYIYSDDNKPLYKISFDSVIYYWYGESGFNDADVEITSF